MKTCERCGNRMVNESTNPNKDNWVCKNTRCVDSTYHRDVRCPVCGSRPEELTRIGASFASFLRENGHPFTKDAGRITAG